MKLTFIQGGTRLKQDNEGTWYTDGNFNDKVWERYKSYCDEFRVILRKEDKKYSKEVAQSKYNIVPLDKLKLFPVADLNRPMIRNLNLVLKKKVDKEIEEVIKTSDKVIIRSILNHYTLTALKYCKKYKKPYLIEVAGYAFDGYWSHGDLLGKLAAIPYEILVKVNMKKAPYSVYVTNEALQKRYPTNGRELGCSDVELRELDENILINKIDKYKNNDGKKIIMGTLGWVNLKTKGQHDVIKALYKLKTKGITNFEYQLVGAGDDTFLRGLIKKYNLEEIVHIVGGKTHEEVFTWLETIDLYIQPSYQEGLCRAIVEAMSKACPIIASNAGGNYELTSKKYIFKKGNVNQIVKILENITIDELIKESKRSFENSKDYQKEILDKKRDEFYREFINEGI